MASNMHLSDDECPRPPAPVDIITIKNENISKIQSMKENISTIANKIDSLKELINDKSDVLRKYILIELELVRFS